MSVSETMKVSVEAIRVLIKAVGVPIVIVGEPKEAARVYNTLTTSTTLSQQRETFWFCSDNYLRYRNVCASVLVSLTLLGISTQL